MLYARLIVGIALILMAAFGPGVGLRPITDPKLRQGNAAQGSVNGAGHRVGGVGRPDQRRATVLILRILAAMLGLWLFFFSSVQLLHGHGHLPH